MLDLGWATGLFIQATAAGIIDTASPNTYSHRNTLSAPGDDVIKTKGINKELIMTVVSANSNHVHKNSLIDSFTALSLCSASTGPEWTGNPIGPEFRPEI